MTDRSPVRLNKAVAAAGMFAESNLSPKLGIAQDSTEAPTDEQLNAQREIRDALNLVSALVNEHISDGRLRSMAETKLEEALLIAGKGVFA